MRPTTDGVQRRLLSGTDGSSPSHNFIFSPYGEMRRASLKRKCPQGRAGSPPAWGIESMCFRGYEVNWQNSSP
jgi:hypothetical protein